MVHLDDLADRLWATLAEGDQTICGERLRSLLAVLQPNLQLATCNLDGVVCLALCRNNQ